MIRGRKISLILTWLVLIAVPFPLIIILNTGIIDTPAHLAAYDLGIIAYVWWLMIVLLSTRPHWLEQRIGMPAMYAIHGALGVMALVATTVHRFTSFSMFPLIKQTGDAAWYLSIVMLGYAVLFLTGWLTDRLKNFRRIKEFLEKTLLHHQVTMWVHRLNFVVIALIWLHVQIIPRLGIVPDFRMTFNIYTVVVLLAYLWWKLRINIRSSAVVIKNEPLTTDLQELTLRLNKQQKNYRPGNFYFMSFRGIRGLSSEAHPFSVASAPVKSSAEVKFTIHRLGDYTWQISSVPVGTRVTMEGPFGLFDREVKLSNGPVILYGLGSGIAPLISLAQEYRGQKELHLIWSGCQVTAEYYQQQLAVLKTSGVKVDVQEHRFTNRDLVKIISLRELKEGRVIIVGSTRMVLTVRKLLMKVGFRRRQLTDERMTL